MADVIGIQSISNLTYFKSLSSSSPQKVEVLNNWLSGNRRISSCPILIKETKLANRVIFIYAGNIGVAQALHSLIELIDKLKILNNIGFILIGRGTELLNIKRMIKDRDLENVIIYDEIDAEFMPGLFDQCHAGLVWLDPRHKTSNIPGKFIAYIQSGLPVLASINPDNDLERIIVDNNIGVVCTSDLLLDRVNCSIALINKIKAGMAFKDRCLNLFENQYSVSIAAKQIIERLQKNA